MKTTMKQFEMHPMRLLAAACGMIALLALTTAAVAQQAAPTASKTVASPTASTGVAAKTAAKPVAEEESAAPNSPNQQGIKVHGHWVLQVKNADGTLGERREFDNSLVTGNGSVGGNQVLAALISGNATAGDPAIAFYPSVPASETDMSSLCNPSSGQGSNTTCYLLTTASTGLQLTEGLGYSYVSTGLTTTMTMNPAVSWVLAGNYTVPSGLTSIALVQTIYTMCIPTSSPILYALGTNSFTKSSTTRTADLSPAACVQSTQGENIGSQGQDNQYKGTLTSTAVSPSALAVTPGQIVQVTVTISFS
jgi:hypothetical protein